MRIVKRRLLHVIEITVKHNYKHKRAVEAVNLKTNEVHYSPSFYRTEKGLGVTCDLVRKICKGIGYHKTARSKFDDYNYTFEYVD